VRNVPARARRVVYTQCVILGGGGVEFRLAVVAEPDEEEHEAAEWRESLAEELGELDIPAGSVAALPVLPGKAKGAGAAIALLAQVPATAAAAVVQFVRDWVSRTGRAVEVTIDGDTIKVSRASQGQQDQLIEAWLGRHIPRT
jgi:hypothetical protein